MRLGQSVNLEHLAPFVNASREKFKKENANLLSYMDEKDYLNFIEDLVKKDIQKGVQIMQYQVITLQTTNGRPWLSI